jgi:secreted trypsin-like serine protease
MKKLHTFILTFLAAAVSPGAAQEKPRLRPIDKVINSGSAPLATTDKIVGGEPASAGEYPFQVALILSQIPEGSEQLGQFCGASLIGSGWVLTAAHCVPNTKPEEIDIYAGSTVLPAGGGAAGGALGIRRSVSKVVPHKDYNPDTNDNDIALLKLGEPIPETLVPAVPVTPEVEASSAQVGTDADVIGWGLTTEGGSTTPQLMKVKVAIQDSALCQSNYNEFLEGLPGAGGLAITKNMFCAGRPEGGVDSCQGDSGGFIGVQTKENGWVQLGVVSFGIGCGRPELFGVYTRVANYGDWIKEVQENF